MDQMYCKAGFNLVYCYIFL